MCMCLCLCVFGGGVRYILFVVIIKHTRYCEMRIRTFAHDENEFSQRQKVAIAFANHVVVIGSLLTKKPAVR